MAREPIILQHMTAPGDIMCMTPLVRDLERAFPGKYAVEVLTSCPSLWEHNPYVSRILASPYPGVPYYKLNYGWCITEANLVPLHFMTAFHREFEKKTGIHVPVTEPRPDLYLSEKEKNERLIDGRYWLMFAGGKADMTTKIQSAQTCQKVVNGLKAFGINVVQTGATYRDNWHPNLEGTLNIIGKAGLRDTLRLIYHADGVLCPITFGMHAAAAFERPCVVWAGGREHWWWEAYVNHPEIQNFGPVASGKVRVEHRYLHTQDLLDCCRGRGCWMNKVQRSEADKYKLYCKYPEDDGYGQIIPRCQKMITAHHIIAAVLSYYEEGILDPIGPKPKVFLPSGELLREESLVYPHVTVPPVGARFGNQINPQEEAARQATLADSPRVVGNFVGQSGFLQGTNKVGDECRMEDPMDSFIIGGKFTICVLMYGDYADLHRKCLGSIMRTIPISRREIRVACNSVCATTREWLDELYEQKLVSKIYDNKENIGKYPAMRHMFHDPEMPLTTPYVVWFDDDSIADRDPQWWQKLAQTIINHHQQNKRMYGPLLYYRAPIDVIKARPWYTGRPFRLQNGTPSPKGDKIMFVHGAFWALCTEVIKELDLPDAALGHNGGDWIMGEQVWQGGYEVRHWNGQRQFINHSSVKRRGKTEPSPGDARWSPRCVN